MKSDVKITRGITRGPQVLSVIASVATLTLAGCASAESGRGSPASGSANAASPSPAPTDIAGLTTAIKAANAQVSSVHLSIDTSASSGAAGSSQGEGDITLANGKTKDFSITTETGSTTLAIVSVDDQGYVKLPNATNPSTPWAKISTDSTNPIVATLAKTFDSVQQQASLDSYSGLLSAGSDFQSSGSTTVDGVKANGYQLTVDPSKLPSIAGVPSAAAASIPPIPVTLDVDQQNRLVQIKEQVTVATQTVTVTIHLTDYNTPVTITAPPADQIGA